MTGRRTPVRRRQLALALRRAREAAKMTLSAAAKALDHDQSWLSRIENAETRISEGDCGRLLALYGISQQEIDELVVLAKQARQRPWYGGYRRLMEEGFAPFLGFESEASTIRTYRMDVIPGLLQTEQYIRAIVSDTMQRRTSEEIERLTALRMERQELLTGDNPPAYIVVLDESAVRRIIGSRHVMREQIEHLIKISTGMSHVQIRVLPYETGGTHAGKGGSFIALDFNAPTSNGRTGDDRIIYVETLTKAHLFDDGDDVSAYSALFEQVLAEALSEQATRRFLEQVAKEFTN